MGRCPASSGDWSIPRHRRTYQCCYGACFEGLSALLTMLNSCASGVTVVNIDNGFGAAYSAGLINMKIADNRKGD
jgi:NCAIR mutase (PurE)-related protein